MRWKDHEEPTLIIDHSYYLWQLPHSTFFTWNGKRYKTILPPVVTMAILNHKRPCMDMITFKEVGIKYKEEVILSENIEN